MEENTHHTIDLPAIREVVHCTTQPIPPNIFTLASEALRGPNRCGEDRRHPMHPRIHTTCTDEHPYVWRRSSLFLVNLGGGGKDDALNNIGAAGNHAESTGHGWRVKSDGLCGQHPPLSSAGCGQETAG